MRKLYMAGDQLSNKELIARVGNTNHGTPRWVWKCLTCGGEHGPSTISHLRRSAMCLDCRNTRELNPRWKGHEQLTGVWLGQYRADAAKRGVEWAVSAEQLWDLWLAQEGRCAYTGWQLGHGVDASLDRTDNRQGYVPGNVRWVHRDINRMKSDFAEDYFVLLCKSVLDIVGLDSAVPTLIADFSRGL